MKPDRKRVYVIGASRGIGAAIAVKLASAGFELILTSREDNGPVTNVLADLGALNCAAEHRICRLDVEDRAQLDQMAELLRDDEEIYGLVYVAGQSYDVLAGAVDHERAARLMTVNYVGFQNLSSAAIRPMTRARNGRIVAIGSVTADHGTAGNAIYAASKAAIQGFVRSLAVEVARKGVTVNCVAPGFVDTLMLDPYRAYLARLLEQIPARRLARPEEVAGLVSYVLSPEAGYVNGTILTIDGGLSANLVSRN